LIFVKIVLYALLKRENTKTSPLKSFVSSSFESFERKRVFRASKEWSCCMLEKIKRIVSLIVFAKKVVFYKICILSTLLVRNFIEKEK
jgi:hypothetical protein